MSYFASQSTISSLGAVSKFTTDDLNVVTPVGGNINLEGGSNLTSTGAGSTVTYSLSGTTDHAIQIGNASGSLTSLLVGASNTALLAVTGSDPIFGTVPNATLTNSSVTLNSGNNITVTGSSLSLGGTATIALSGTTLNAVQIGSASGALTSVVIGLTNTVLLGSTGAPPSFGTIPNAVLDNSTITLNDGDNITVTSSPIALGASGTIALSGMTEHSLQVGNAAGSLTNLGVAANGQLPIGSMGAIPVLATITGGSNVNVTNGAGSITVNLDTNVTLSSLTLLNPLVVPSGGIGTNALTDHGILIGSGTSAITALGVATDGEIAIGSSGADPVLGTITAGLASEVTNAAGSITVGLTENDEMTAIHGWNGYTIEEETVTVTAAGGVITLSIERTGGGDLTGVFSDGYFDWDTTPADTVTLTAGSDTSPQTNYIFLPLSTKVLTANTSGFPAAEHIPVAVVICQSGASLQTEGAYSMHAWTDHVDGTTENGHLSHLSHWIRHQPATWKSGVVPTLTINAIPSPDEVIFTSSSGETAQLHDHVFPAFTGTPDIYTVNDSATPYNIVTDLNVLLTDSTGGSMSNKYFSLVIWGIQSQSQADCKLMLNLPGGSYNTEAGLTADASKFANFTIPRDFVGTAFLIAQLQLRHQAAAGGTWTEIDLLDLRGLIPSSAPGGATSAQTEFVDNTFRILDQGDATKEIAFQADGITTVTTRTITMADRDVDLDKIMPTFETGADLVMVVNTKYIANGGISLNLTLPVTIAQGARVTVLGKGTGGWSVAQNAGQTIHDVAGDTTTGAGGSYASSNRYDTVTLECITANTDFVVVSSEGVPTIT